jgi:hypothetical protein
MDLPETVVALLAMAMSFLLPLAVVLAILHYKHRRLKLVHQTIAQLADKGLPVPPELIEPPRARHFALRGGLLLVALGVGLAAFFAIAGGPWSIGLIPGLMGAALLLSWTIENRGR